MNPTPDPVLVGVDGSVAAKAAVDVGAWEAKRRRVPLLLVHAYQDWLPYSVTGLPASPGLVTAVRDGAWAMLDDTVNRAHAEHHGVTIRPSLVTSGAASSLIELSHGVGLVVVGSRGTGGFAGLLAGSVSTQVAMHAHAPVMVVRPPYTAVNADEVVVGVDGSPGSVAALDFAFDEANARGTALVAVTADDIAESAVERALARAGEAHPDVVLKPVHTHEPAARVLIDASRHAGLVVVGRRGRGGFPSLLLGSVSHALVAHSHCNVAVVHAGD